MRNGSWSQLRKDNIFLQKAFIYSYLTKLNQLIVQIESKLAIIRSVKTFIEERALAIAAHERDL
jgi:hypothetical protein